MFKIIRYIKPALIILCLLGIAAASPRKIVVKPAIDRFQEIKTEYSLAAMVSFDILITVESKIFDEIDSAFGEISIARDGRYFARLNNDIYLFDGKCTWEFSDENNQATKRCLKEGEEIENRLAFIKNLDDYYETMVIEKNSIYKLIKNIENVESLPDSMKINLSEANLSKIEYIDLNDDLNKIWILRDNTTDSLDRDIFEINLPDSVEVITLP
jgi:outer membrane lipoprotein-sorting protein